MIIWLEWRTNPAASRSGAAAPDKAVAGLVTCHISGRPRFAIDKRCQNGIEPFRGDFLRPCFDIDGATRRPIRFSRTSRKNRRYDVFAAADNVPDLLKRIILLFKEKRQALPVVEPCPIRMQRTPERHDFVSVDRFES